MGPTLKPAMPWSRVTLYLATIVALALTVRAVLGDPPPPWLAVGVTVFYVGLLIWGSLSPALEMYGDVLWRVPEAGARVALTFDDGPDPRTTPQVLEVLARHGVRATFFVLGNKVARHPELAARMVREGHELGVHSWDHNRLYAFLRPADVAADIARCQDEIEGATGQRPRWFRPPVGQMSPRTVAGVARAGCEIVGWSVKGRDGLPSAQPERVLARVVRRLDDGAIVLLHDAWERGHAQLPPAGVLIVERLLAECSARRLKAGSVGQLIEALSKQTS